MRSSPVPSDAGGLFLQAVELRFPRGIDRTALLLLFYSDGKKAEVTCQPRFSKIALVLILAHRADLANPIQRERGWLTAEEVDEAVRVHTGSGLSNASVVAYICLFLRDCRQNVAQQLSEAHACIPFIHRLRDFGYRIDPSIEASIHGYSPPPGATEEAAS